MTWLNRFFHILLKPSSREKGVIFVPLLLAGTLAVGILFYEAYSNDLLQNLDKFRQYAHDVASEHPENADPNSLHDALEATKNTLKPSRTPVYTAPYDPSAWGEYLAYGQVTDFVEQNINTPTPGPGGRGRPGQPAACSLSVEPAQAAPGEYVTVTVTVPTPFKSRIVSISGQAGLSGFSISPSGGSTAFSIPGGYCHQYLQVFYEAYGQEGLVSSGTTSVKVDFSGLPDFDSDGIVDRCDPDDDNDGSLDSADCAPLDPDRFPGNPEICGDGIDQDCDGEDKPCETPGNAIVWMHDGNVKMTWYEAQQYCVAKGGLLPTSLELKQAWEDGGKKMHPEHTPGFSNWLYWGSGSRGSFADVFLFSYGMLSGQDQTSEAYVRCVESQ